MNVKVEFSSWLLENGAESYKQYYGESRQDIEKKLEEINDLFKVRDLFNVEKGNVEELKKFIIENIYDTNIENNKLFYDYDKLKGNGRPKAILGKNNYFKFLDSHPFINLFKIEPQIIKYQNAIDTTDWLKIDEIYKFNFIKWIEEHIDFENDSNEVIKDKIEKSQQQAFRPNSNIKGVNFIQTITRYQDDYITVEDIEKLRGIITNKVSENKESLTLSFSSFPKTSAYLCLFSPDKFMAYDGESIPAYDFLSKDNSNRTNNAPKRNYKAFKFYQIFYKNIKEYLKESQLNTVTFKSILQVNILTELHWNFITQDFLLYITREIMNKGIDIIDIKGNNIYKLSMGSFLKDKNYAHINPVEQFEKNNLIVMHEKTTYNQGHDFANILKKGDYIYLTYGQQRLSFIGKVVGDSKKLNKIMKLGLDDNWICRSIEVIKNPTINNTNDLKDKSGWLPSGYSTFKKIKDIETANKVLFNKYYKVDIIDSKTNTLTEKINYLRNIQPLNQILYGPPGTGKTYKTKKIAVEIIENQVYSDTLEDREIILEKYNQYVEDENIHFTTFHQSMSYEDFIEGIKPTMNSDKSGEIEYEIKSGLFKQICELARVKELTNFDIAYNNFISDFSEKEDEFLDLKTPRGSQFSLKINSNNNLTLFTTKNRNQYGTLTMERLNHFYLGVSVFNGWQGYATGFLEYLEENYNLSKEKKEPNQKCVLIIDEINRGNVSAIFGELITLIETDKRAGEKEAISVTLPYSKTKFSVPNNVFIIGTMNTADRSVEALDTALRRRFSFKEIAPKSELLLNLEYKEVNLEKLLHTINQRIEILIDKDHQIGHSYFFSIKKFSDLKLVFKDKIIPLLEEYFYGDFGKIGLVLGENFIEQQAVKNKSILASFKSYDDLDFVSDKNIFRLKPIDNMEVLDFLSVYQKVES